MLTYAGTFKMLSGGKTLNSFQKFEREIYINYLLENVITILQTGNSFLFHQMHITLSDAINDNYPSLFIHYDMQ